MENIEKTSMKDTSSFLEQWKKHPLSIPVLIILLNLSFLLVLVQGTLDEKKIEIAYIFSVFSLLIFLIIVAVLIWRKFVFYNVTELIILEVDRHIRDIQESLANIEIGIGVAFSDLQTAPLSNDVINNVRKFEMLSNLMKGIDYEFHLNDEANKALAKYYFRTSKIDKALAWIEMVKDKNDSEYNFIKGILLWKKGVSHESRECFSKSKHPKANYYKFVTYVCPFGSDLYKDGLNKFIDEASNENSPLYSDIHAQILLAVAHSRLSSSFPSDGSDIDIKSLQQALQIAEHIARIEKHPAAFFNAACYICRLGMANQELDQTRSYNESLYTTLALEYLEKAMSQDSALLECVVHDKDFEWLKEKAETKYYLLIGTYYEKQTKNKR